MTPARPVRLSRRSVLAGALGFGLLAACGDSGGTSGAEPSDTDPADGSGLALAPFFAPNLVLAGVENRLPVGIVDADGVVRTEVPDSLEFRIVDDDGRSVADDQVVQSRGTGIPRPYFPLRFAPTGEGIHSIEVRVDGGLVTAAFSVVDASQVPAPGVGDTMLAVETPTVADARGVSPICTRDPACPFHEVTLTTALDAATPVAFLISTPAFCQTSICGPVLDLLIDADTDGVAVVHAEVWTDEATALPPDGETTEAVNTYGLPWEPSLYLASADGTVVDRLDNIFDATELAEGLAALSA